MKLLKWLFLIIVISSSCKKDVDQNRIFLCTIENPKQKGERLIGLDLLDETEKGTFDHNILLAKDLGIDFISLHLPWNLIETSKNVYTDPFSALELLANVAQANDMKFSLTIRPIDLTGKTVPTDLESKRFNDPEMVDRFNALVDFIFTKLDPDVLLNFQIGNEIDGYDFSQEADTFWDDYGMFLKSTTEYIHKDNPNLKVGFTGTLYGMLNESTRFNKLAENVDILGVTYYPIKANFDVKSPDVVFDELDELVDKYSDFPLYFQEVGYQSGSENKSSEAKQAEFYCNLFKAWDIHSEKIKTMSMVRLNDLSLEKAVENGAPYGIGSDGFVEYLRTLGIWTFENEGAEKQAFGVLKDNLKARGW